MARRSAGPMRHGFASASPVSSKLPGEQAWSDRRIPEAKHRLPPSPTTSRTTRMISRTACKLAFSTSHRSTPCHSWPRHEIGSWAPCEAGTRISWFGALRASWLDILSRVRSRRADAGSRRRGPRRPRTSESPPDRLLALPPELAVASAAIKSFLFTQMYRHPRLLAMRERAARVVQDLAARFLETPTSLPAKWRQTSPTSPERHARRVTDYVASMTDRFAFAEHRRLFDATPDLR